MAIKKYEELTDSEKFSARAHVEKIMEIYEFVKRAHERRGIPDLKWADQDD